MGLEVDICASFSVKLTVMVSPIPALPPVIVGVPLKSGAVLSIVTPDDNVRLMGLGFLLPPASVAVTSSLFTAPEYAGTAPPDAGTV